MADRPCTGWMSVIDVMDLELDLPPRRPEPVLGHRHLSPLAHDVPTQPDPAAPRELQAEARGLREGTVDRCGRSSRLEHDEPGTDASRVGGQAAQRMLLAGRHVTWKVDHQEIDRPTPEERSRKGESLRRILRPEHEQPAQVHPATDRLERVEDPGQIQERDDRPACLRLRHAAQRERQFAARRITADRCARLEWQPTRAQQRVQGREAGRDGLSAEWLEVDPRHGLGIRLLERQDRGRERTLDQGRGTGEPRIPNTRATSPRTGQGTVPTARRSIDPTPVAEADRRASPPRLQPGQGTRQGRIGGRHRRPIIEHLFYSSRPEGPASA